MPAIRHAQPEDHAAAIAVVDQWWGRRVQHLLPKLWFVHFQPTSFVAEENGRIVAFLVGFISQSDPTVAYIHFAGVDPAHRRRGLGRQMYDNFCESARAKKCTRAACITSPQNGGAVEFHRKLGFEIMRGDATLDGVEVTRDYNGPGEHRVVMRKLL